MMREEDAAGLLDALAERGIDVRLDGGWGVDALLGRQTREHNDLDLFSERRDEDALVALLRERGFAPVGRAFTTEAHTAWADDEDREVDLHVFERAADGSLLFEGGKYLRRRGPHRGARRALHPAGRAGGLPLRLRPRRGRCP